MGTIVLGVPSGDCRNWDWESFRDRIYACLGKSKFKAFPKRVGPWILSLESVGYFGISEHFWVVRKIKNRN